MFVVSANPEEFSSESEIPIEWVDDNEWNAIECAFDAISPRHIMGLSELPRSCSSARPMIAPTFPTSVPASVAPAGFPLRPSSSTPQCGLDGQNLDRGNRADFNLRKATFDGGERRLGQNGFRARSPFPDYCIARSQPSDKFLPFNEDLPRSQAEPDASCSPDGFDTGSNLQAIFEPRKESQKSSVDLSGVEQADSDGGKRGSAEERITRQLPAWMQTNSPLEFSRDSSRSTKQMIKISGPQDVIGTDFVAERFVLPADLDGRSAEATGPSALNQLNPQAQRLPWGIQPSSCVDNAKPKFPIMQFRGQIVYSKTEAEVNVASLELCQRIQQLQEDTTDAVPIGLDVEWRATFERGEVPRKVAVLQLCLDGRRCDVMQIIYSGVPTSLRSILENPSTIKVGLGIHGDVARLYQDHELQTREVVDLREIANKKMKISKQRSLASLALELTGKELQKIPTIRCGDWEAIPLSEPQLLYAATDAFASLHLYQILSSFPTPEAD